MLLYLFFFIPLGFFLNQGKISVQDIVCIAKESGETFTLEEIRQMIREADHNGNLSSSLLHFVFSLVLVYYKLQKYVSVIQFVFFWALNSYP